MSKATKSTYLIIRGIDKIETINFEYFEIIEIDFEENVNRKRIDIV